MISPYCIKNKYMTDFYFIISSVGNLLHVVGDDIVRVALS
jgi:hypothetical protein